MKTNDGLTEADIDSYDAVVIQLLIMLDPFTVEEIRRFDYLCDLIWEMAVNSRRERTLSDRLDPAYPDQPPC